MSIPLIISFAPRPYDIDLSLLDKITFVAQLIGGHHRYTLIYSKLPIHSIDDWTSSLEDPYIVGADLRSPQDFNFSGSRLYARRNRTDARLSDDDRFTSLTLNTHWRIEQHLHSLLFGLLRTLSRRNKLPIDILVLMFTLVLNRGRMPR
jgi:hypothetical protein